MFRWQCNTSNNTGNQGNITSLKKKKKKKKKSQNNFAVTDPSKSENEEFKIVNGCSMSYMKTKKGRN